MARRAFEVAPEEDDGDDRPRVRARDVVSIRETLDELGMARCPLCRAMLVARMSRTGPYFFCLCPRKALRRAS